MCNKLSSDPPVPFSTYPEPEGMAGKQLLSLPAPQLQRGLGLLSKP